MTEKEDQDNSKRSERNTQQPSKHDVDRARQEEKNVHQHRVEGPPEAFPAAHVPKSPVRETYFLREVGDLPVVICVRERVAGILGICELEQISEPRHDCACCNNKNPPQGERYGLGLGHRLWFADLQVDAPILLFFVDEQSWQHFHAVAASAEIRSCDRATSRRTICNVSRCRSPSKRRACSNAR